MKVRLISYSCSKIQAIKCLRDACPFMNLQMAKFVCESLPYEVQVQSADRVEDLRECFEFDLNAGESVLWIRKAWNALDQDRQDQLLQYLVAVGMLREK